MVKANKINKRVVSSKILQKATLIIINIISLVINSILIYYILRLENLSGCDCISDWRKEYLKYYSIFSILTSILGIALVNYLNKFPMALIITLVILNVLAIYCLYTYMTRLQDQCPCSINNTTNKNLNTFFYVYAIIIIFIVSIFIKSTISYY
jgi:hypothetical protein